MHPMSTGQVLSSSGQAAEQGIVMGDVIFSIGDTVLQRGVDKAGVCSGYS